MANPVPAGSPPESVTRKSVPRSAEPERITIGTSVATSRAAGFPPGRAKAAVTVMGTGPESSRTRDRSTDSSTAVGRRLHSSSPKGLEAGRTRYPLLPLPRTLASLGLVFTTSSFWFWAWPEEVK